MAIKRKDQLKGASTAELMGVLLTPDGQGADFKSLALMELHLRRDRIEHERRRRVHTLWIIAFSAALVSIPFLMACPAGIFLCR